ncbi:MAG: hypothetical protein ACYDFQ_04775 [Vulcanimicrobiaceae bacterium]
MRQKSASHTTADAFPEGSRRYFNVLFIVLAVLTAPVPKHLPTPTPTPSALRRPLLPLKKPAYAPCAHRLFCGPIHLLPRNPRERAAFLTDVAAAVADGLITAAGTHRNPALEGDPVVQPFIRGGLPSMLFGWALGDVARSALTRRWTPGQRTLALRYEAGWHIVGIGSWISPIAYTWNSPPILIQAALHAPVTEGLWLQWDERHP